MKKIFGLIGLLLGLVILINGVCLLTGVIETSTTGIPVRSFGLAALFIAFGWNWFREETPS